MLFSFIFGMGDRKSSTCVVWCWCKEQVCIFFKDRWAPRGHIYFRCLILILSGPVVDFCCVLRHLIWCGKLHRCLLMFVYYYVCTACCMFYCIGELFLVSIVSYTVMRLSCVVCASCLSSFCLRLILLMLIYSIYKSSPGKLWNVSPGGIGH